MQCAVCLHAVLASVRGRMACHRRKPNASSPPMTGVAPNHSTPGVRACTSGTRPSCPAANAMQGQVGA
eukprot:153115-Lingulodinium_polyedra.AAC.1